MRKFIFLTFYLLAIFYVNAQELVTDFSFKDGDKGSWPSDFIKFNGLLYFEATTESYGREIWVTNGNKDEAFLLKDFNLGFENGITTSFKESSVILNNTLYFIASDGSSKGEIWKSDGTPEGTEKVTNFLDCAIRELTLIGDKIYFLVQDYFSFSLQVWISDGSEEGTKLVKSDIPIMNKPSFQGKCNNIFIFTFQPYGSNDACIYRSDGTSEGTYSIINEIDGNGAGESGTSDLTQYIEYNNELFFVSRFYIYKTDGTIENTKTIASPHNASIQLIDYADVIEVNGKLYFSFFEMDYNHLFIYESDGTLTGTNKIYNEWGASYFIPSNLCAYENNLLFTWPNENGGTSLIKFNLDDYSKIILKELESNLETPSYFYEDSHLCKIYSVGDSRFFISSPIKYLKSTGWMLDINKGETTHISELDDVLYVIAYGDLFFFSKLYEHSVAELWRSDGTANNSLICDNINKSKYGSNSSNLISLNSELIFTANDGIVGDELWKYNGTNVELIKDIREGKLNSYSRSFFEFKNEKYFVADDSIHGNELWKTNGKNDETIILNDISSGETSSYPKYFNFYKDNLYFTAKKDNHTYLCRTEGTKIELIKDFGENDYGTPYYITGMISNSNYLFFFLRGDGEDLWISDGTEVGTIKLHDFVNCNDLIDINDNVFFNATDENTNEMELWITDGTEVKTKMVKDIGIGYSSEPEDFIEFNDLLYFTAYTKEEGREIWKSNGTNDGTVQLKDINLGENSSVKDINFCVLNEKLFFNANDGEHGSELWNTDGTLQGTSIVFDINSGFENSSPSNITAINDYIYFSAFDQEHGKELWKSDGTEYGTELVADILIGSLSSYPDNIINISDDIFFVAESKDNGRQIWKINYHDTYVDEFKMNPNMYLFPNPCLDNLYFNIDENIEIVYIYNIAGQLVNVEKVKKNSINVSYLQPGIYFILYKVNNTNNVQKIIKE